MISPAYTPKAPQHRGEDRTMNRVEEVPIRKPGVPGWIKHRCQTYQGVPVLGRDFVVEPQPSWHFHLSGEQQPAIGLDTHDPPEINRVPRAELVRVPPPASHTVAAAQFVECAPHRPEPVRPIPPLVPRSSGYARTPEAGWRTRAPRARSPTGGSRGFRPNAPPSFAASTSLQDICANSLSSLISARWIASDRPRGVTGKASRAAASRTTVSLRRLSIIAAATRRTRVSHAERQARGAKRLSGQRHDPPMELALARVLAHHLGVAHLVIAAYLENCAPSTQREGGHEILDEVLDGDRLSDRFDPLGGWDRRQSLNHCPDRLEGGAAGTDHYRGPQLDRGHPGPVEDLADLVAAGEVSRRFPPDPRPLR